MNENEINLGDAFKVNNKKCVIIAQLGKENPNDNQIWYEVEFENGSTDHIKIEELTE